MAFLCILAILDYYGSKQEKWTFNALKIFKIKICSLLVSNSGVILSKKFFFQFEIISAVCLLSFGLKCALVIMVCLDF